MTSNINEPKLALANYCNLLNSESPSHALIVLAQDPSRGFSLTVGLRALAGLWHPYERNNVFGLSYLFWVGFPELRIDRCGSDDDLRMKLIVTAMITQQREVTAEFISKHLVPITTYRSSAGTLERDLDLPAIERQMLRFADDLQTYLNSGELSDDFDEIPSMVEHVLTLHAHFKSFPELIPPPPSFEMFDSIFRKAS